MQGDVAERPIWRSRAGGLCDLQRNVMDGDGGERGLLPGGGTGKCPPCLLPTVEVKCPAVSGGHYAERLWPQCEKILKG